MFNDVELRPEEFNAEIVEAIESGELEKVAAFSTAYIRKRILEPDSLARVILNAEPVTFEELEKDLNHTAYHIFDIEQDQFPAFDASFTSKPPTKYIQTNQGKSYIRELDTEKYVKNITEIMFMKHPFDQEIEENAKHGIKQKEGLIFKNLVDAALASTGFTHTITPAPGQTYIYKEDIITGMNLLIQNSNPVDPATFLMNKTTWNTIMNWNKQEFGDEVGQITFKGMTFDTLLGAKVVTTRYTSLIPHNEIYIFAEPKYLGGMGILKDVTMYTEKKEKDLYYWFTEQIFMFIGNPGGVAKVVLP